MTSINIAAYGEYYSKGSHALRKEKVTHLHFFLHDVLSGQNPIAIKAAASNRTQADDKSPAPFGSVFVACWNPVSKRDRELEVVGGKGKFRMANEFAKVKTNFLNVATSDAVLEYNVTLVHS
ncbi:unnamed protein product [Dovyalis caffra]|uniref:Dirigent protein n=1 Tax=Dovyalis caffra TaxID=77055 RepID=A0AAV1R692_9ROSI|nr:unnamed protein product [Dovyalis caffra]